jgi:hypothetical protein
MILVETKIDHAVVTAQAYFSDAQRQAAEGPVRVPGCGLFVSSTGPPLPARFWNARHGHLPA